MRRRPQDRNCAPSPCRRTASSRKVFGGTGMIRQSRRAATAIGAAVLVVGVVVVAIQTFGQSPPAPYRVPRTSDGKPDLSGIWQAVNTANWDLQDHSARQGPVIALGAAFSVPAGKGVVEGNEIPYQPAALKQKQENQAHWLERD